MTTIHLNFSRHATDHGREGAIFSGTLCGTVRRKFLSFDEMQDMLTMQAGEENCLFLRKDKNSRYGDKAYSVSSAQLKHFVTEYKELRLAVRSELSRLEQIDSLTDHFRHNPLPVQPGSKRDTTRFTCRNDHFDFTAEEIRSYLPDAFEKADNPRNIEYYFLPSAAPVLLSGHDLVKAWRELGGSVNQPTHQPSVQHHRHPG